MRRKIGYPGLVCRSTRSSESFGRDGIHSRVEVGGGGDKDGEPRGFLGSFSRCSSVRMNFESQETSVHRSFVIQPHVAREKPTPWTNPPLCRNPFRKPAIVKYNKWQISPPITSAYMPSVRTGICHKSNQSGFLVVFFESKLWSFSAQCAMHSERSYWSFQPPGHLVNALNFTLSHLVSPLFVTLTLCVPIHPEFSHEIQKANATDSNTEADSDGAELQISKLIMYVLL